MMLRERRHRIFIPHGDIANIVTVLLGNVHIPVALFVARAINRILPNRGEGTRTTANFIWEDTSA